MHVLNVCMIVANLFVTCYFVILIVEIIFFFHLQVREGGDSTDTEGKMVSLDTSVTNDGSTDRKGNPAIKTISGGWRSAVLLLGKIHK